MSVFKIRPGEERMSMLLVGLMLFTAVGSAIGSNATEALFLTRFGVELLPTMYILLGLVNFITSMVITVVMGRISRQRLYVSLPLGLGLLLVGERLIILLNIPWFYALMWLAMYVIIILQALLTWGLAGTVCDTRQSKRLFPLFTAGGIFGIVLGGLVTPLLAAWLHAENLLLIWAGALFVSFVLARALAGYIPAVRMISHAPRPAVVEEMQRGYQFVRRSPIMRWISYSAVLFSVCFFSLALPFSRETTAQFQDADSLAGFLGLFQSVSTSAALLLSLFLANRLFARFGILSMVLVYPIIYLTGFGVLAFSAAVDAAAFPLLVAFRFTQMAYMNGIAMAAWYAIFNVVPPEQRDQVRAFVSGVPEQAGTFIAGLVLFLGEQALIPQQLYLIGFTASALLVYIIWRASRVYALALVDALRAGQPHVFLGEEQPFAGTATDEARIDAMSISVAIRGLSDSDPRIRRVSAEIIALIQSPIPEASAALINALVDEDPLVKISALKGLAQAQATLALLEVTTSLSDPEPEVRRQAIITLRQLAPSPRGLVAQVEPLFSDADPFVRVQAALTLLCAIRSARARETLHGMAADTDPSIRAQALAAFGECRDESAFGLVAAALDDAQPVVRKAAARALVEIDRHEALNLLLRHLDDGDTAVRDEVARSLGKVGEPALEPLIAAMDEPSHEECALKALEYFPVKKAEQQIRAHARAAAQAALHYHNLAAGVAQIFKGTAEEDGRFQLLFDSLIDQAKRNGMMSLRALRLLSNRKTAASAITAAIENLQSPSASQRANALETLDTVGERDLIRPLLALWEVRDGIIAKLPEDWLANLLDDPNSWLRACAVMVTSLLPRDARLIEKLRRMSSTDPDEMVRIAARNSISGGQQMETLATLSIMDRILFLRRVPLFAGLQPTELKQVAAITSELLFTDRQALACQGEMGSEMYIIVSGEVRVLITAEKQDEPREVARRRPGDYVGEMAVINQEPRIANLIADGAVRVLCIKQNQLESILRECPEIGMAMIRTLSQRLKEASKAAALH